MRKRTILFMVGGYFVGFALGFAVVLIASKLV